MPQDRHPNPPASSSSPTSGWSINSATRPSITAIPPNPKPIPATPTNPSNASPSNTSQPMISNTTPPPNQPISPTPPAPTPQSQSQNSSQTLPNSTVSSVPSSTANPSPPTPPIPTPPPTPPVNNEKSSITPDTNQPPIQEAPKPMPQQFIPPPIPPANSMSATPDTTNIQSPVVSPQPTQAPSTAPIPSPLPETINPPQESNENPETPSLEPTPPQSEIIPPDQDPAAEPSAHITENPPIKPWLKTSTNFKSQTESSPGKSNSLPAWRRSVTSHKQKPASILTPPPGSSHTPPPFQPPPSGKLVSIDSKTPRQQLMITLFVILLIIGLCIGALLYISYKNLYSSLSIPNAVSHTIDRVILAIPVPHTPEQLARTAYYKYHQQDRFSYRGSIILSTLNGQTDTTIGINGIMSTKYDRFNSDIIIRDKNNSAQTTTIEFHADSKDIYTQINQEAPLTALNAVTHSGSWIQSYRPQANQPNLAPGQQSLKKIRSQRLDDLISNIRESFSENLAIPDTTQLKFASSYTLNSQLSQEQSNQLLAELIQIYQDTQITQKISQEEYQNIRQSLTDAFQSPIEISVRINQETLLPQTITLNTSILPEIADWENLTGIDQTRALINLNIEINMEFDNPTTADFTPTQSISSQDIDWNQTAPLAVMKPFVFFLSE